MAATYCDAAPGHPVHGPYHDTEYGFPSRDDSVLFERLVLEINQAGLSWLTILNKRAAFQKAYRNFDIDAVAGFGARDVKRLLGDERVIRNRRKLEAIVQNAKATVAMRDDRPLPEVVWSFRPPPARAPRTYADMASLTDESKQLAKELKREGFAFVGPTTVYSTMQAVGLVNDHLAGCFVRKEVEAAQHSVQRLFPSR